MPRPNAWYVVTGGPSVGKTTLLAQLEKLGYATVPEAARLWIDENLAKGISVQELRKDEEKFQEDLVHMKQRVESNQSKAAVTFFDRGMHDTLAYLESHGFKPADWVIRAMQEARYRKVFLLEPLPTFVKDYARVEDAAFTQKLTGMLEKAYADYDMQPIRVPALPIKQRLKFVLDHLDQA